MPGLVDFLAAGEPRLIAFNEYTGEDRTEVSVVQVHPDAESMEFHMGVVKDRATRAYDETLDRTTRIQVFDAPSASMLKTLRGQAGTGVDISINSMHLGGFTRAMR
jgi:hypothetical protein